MPLSSKLVARLKRELGHYKTHGLPNTTEFKDAQFKKLLYTSTRVRQSNQDRMKFLDYLAQHRPPETISPQTTSLKNLLGEKGLALYKFALQEEINSIEFRDAVCSASTSTYEGKTWHQRPIIFIAGPSGCGKSYAAKNIIKKLNESGNAFKKDTSTSENIIVSADNGIARETSQIRKLAIQVANAQGYQGISDLHEQSNVILQPIKSYIKKAVLHTKHIGIVFPETFSRWSMPFWNPMKKLAEKGDDKLIFCLVEGVQAGEFKKVVKFLGERRAWKTKDISNVDFGLNTSEGVPESKRYEEKSFDIGLNGSKKASAWFKKHIPFGLHLVEKNTLRLITNKEGEMDVEPTPIHNTIKLTDKNMLSNCRRTLGFTPFTKDTHTPPRLIATEKTNPYANNPAMNLSHKRYPEGIGLLARQNNRVTDESSGMLSPQENEEIAIQHAIDLLSTSTSSARHFNLSGKDIAQIQKVHAALLWFKLNNTHYEDIHIHSDYGPNQQGNRSIFFKRTETEETFIKQHLKSNFLESFKKSALDNTPIFKKNPANY